VLVLSGANVDPEMIGRSLFVPALFDPTLVPPSHKPSP
jgi:hypothetical protein